MKEYSVATGTKEFLTGVGFNLFKKQITSGTGYKSSGCSHKLTEGT